MTKIVSDPKICGGSPTIAGTRVRVLDIAIEFEHLGMSPDEIVRAHPHLTLAQVHAALAYFYEHIKEMRAEIKKEEKYLEMLKKHYPSKIVVTA